MHPRKVVAYMLFTIAAIISITILLFSFLEGNIKGFGAGVFAGFFLFMAGWIIGDF